ncbi:hypothetical protein UFOVP5_40 [uncultured Caudovirales phage]|uniref:Uncharacterized protein n=1 Tax=uncultured Caudovirales phage TaxID=2100421 RepID=A0A6J5KHE7_9CAUD|nr:hypothetical protein UFOVP5_40 [uncultured Caudovirales phage]
MLAALILIGAAVLYLAVAIPLAMLVGRVIKRGCGE